MTDQLRISDSGEIEVQPLMSAVETSVGTVSSYYVHRVSPEGREAGLVSHAVSRRIRCAAAQRWASDDPPACGGWLPVEDQLRISDQGEIEVQPLTDDGEPLYSPETLRELFNSEAFQQVRGQTSMDTEEER